MKKPARIIAIGLLAALSANSLALRYEGPLLWGILALVTMVALAFWLQPRLGDVSLVVVAFALIICLFIPGLRTSVEVFPVVFYAAYLAGAYSRIGRAWLGVLLAATGGVALTTVLGSSLNGNPMVPAGMPPLAIVVVAVAGTWVVLGFFWLLGTQTRRRQEDIMLLRERAEMAGVVERTRIAREMHDIVAHTLSGIMSVADGARFAALKNPQVAVDALEVISEQSRQALAEMRGLLSVLRTDDSRALNSVPSATELQSLFKEARRIGQEVTVQGVENFPELPELIQFTVYRVVQEMLSNMIRHGAGPGVLTIEYGDRLRIISRNPTASPSAEDGHGLTGMRERVRAVHGTLAIGQKNGQFVVVAEVPA